MGLQRGVVRRLSCRTAPLDPEPRQGSFLAIGLIELTTVLLISLKTIVLAVPTLILNISMENAAPR